MARYRGPTGRRRGQLLAAALLLSGAASLAGGCESSPEIKAESAAGATGSDAHSEASPGDLGCAEGLPGPALVRIETKADEVYCVDQREVTWAEYKTFMAAKAGDISGQPGECDWNTSYAPEYRHPDDDTPPYIGYKCPAGSQPTSDQTAANCLDFCDAIAYCEWAGKRLCGRIGGTAKWGRVDVGVKADAGDVMAEWEALSKVASSTAMEFGYTCTQGGMTFYPYGDTYEPGRCLDATWIAEKGADSLQVTDLSNRTCHGSEPPFDQVFDLSGSVGEWQNLARATPGAGLSGLVIGGSSSPEDAVTQACADDFGFGGIRHRLTNVGFRCCADGVPKSPASP